MLDALHAFFATSADGAVHSLNWSAEVIKKHLFDFIYQLYKHRLLFSLD